MKTAPIQYLALGDSYTIGEGVPSDLCWPNQLVRNLRTAGLDILDPLIVAKTGWTTGDLLNAITGNEPLRMCKLVTLMIGVNNQYQGLSLTGYRLEFCELLERAAGFAGGLPSRVVVLSIPDWSTTPFAEGRDRDQIHSAVQAFNRVNSAETALFGAHYIDVTPISRRASFEPDLLAEDNLHPSSRMYSEWVALVYPLVYEILMSGKY